jgi:hypothetical protein
MGIRRQAYEWRNLITEQLYDAGFTSTQGHPILTPPNFGASAGPFNNPVFSVRLPADGVSIFTGGRGNNLDIPAALRATQFVVIDSISGWDGQSARIGESQWQDAFIQIRVNETYYFQTPDGRPAQGLPTSAVPFPDHNLQPVTDAPKELQPVQPLYTFESFRYGLPTPVYILPGQVWDIIYRNPKEDQDNTIYNDAQVSYCYVKYLLLDGADAAIAMKLLKASFPVTVENINGYRRMLIRHEIFEDTMARLDNPTGTRRVD